MAEDFGDLSTAFIPVFIDSSSNEFEIGLVDGPFSDGNGPPARRGILIETFEFPMQ